MSTHFVEASRFVRVEPVRAYDLLLGTPLPDIFVKRYAAFPAVSEVRDQPDDWGAVGHSRTIMTKDGGSMLETLVSVDRPDSYGYVLDEITGPMRPFVRSVDGVWSVAAEEDGARIGWSWTLHPTAPPARLTMNVIARMWRGYADRALERIETLFVP